MLEPILGSLSCERVLVFILVRKEGYAREIARFFAADLDPVQKQLEKLEVGGVLESRTAGRTRLYSFNPRYRFPKELKSQREN
jgi:predicted transcriptional regulator